MSGKQRGEGGTRTPGRHDGGGKREWIASQLRRVYDEALHEDIPADMLALLEKLDRTSEDGEKA
jgi:Anti-sigma factor NepR